MRARHYKFYPDGYFSLKNFVFIPTDRSISVVLTILETDLPRLLRSPPHILGMIVELAIVGYCPVVDLRPFTSLQELSINHSGATEWEDLQAIGPTFEPWHVIQSHRLDKFISIFPSFSLPSLAQPIAARSVLLLQDVADVDLIVSQRFVGVESLEIRGIIEYDDCEPNHVSISIDSMDQLCHLVIESMHCHIASSSPVHLQLLSIASHHVEISNEIAARRLGCCDFKVIQSAIDRSAQQLTILRPLYGERIMVDSLLWIPRTINVIFEDLTHISSLSPETFAHFLLNRRVPTLNSFSAEQWMNRNVRALVR